MSWNGSKRGGLSICQWLVLLENRNFIKRPGLSADIHFSRCSEPVVEDVLSSRVQTEERSKTISPSRRVHNNRPDRIVLVTPHCKGDNYLVAKERQGRQHSESMPRAPQRPGCSKDSLQTSSARLESPATFRTFLRRSVNHSSSPGMGCIQGGVRSAFVRSGPQWHWTVIS